MAELTLAVAQFTAGRDTAANADACARLIAATGGRAGLTVLPENAMYSDPLKEGDGYSESLDGPFITRIREAARTAGVNVLVGFTETSETPRPYNTLVFVQKDGEIGGVYRKIHLYDAFGFKESDRVEPAPIGDPLVFEIDGVRVGALTCYDLRFPEASRWLADHDVHVIALPAAWATGPAKELHWETLIRARAIENTLYFAGCGQTLPHCTGASIIIDPMGATVASAGEEPEAIAYGSVRTERVETVREKNPSLANRKFAVVPKGL
ncbi:carbon-nitrogen hydrolase family protein [Sediminivirga luteola]|uniref:carbon-nitrogen hydrolase family protein n=1 Tax=Sediminivirga luteola TaxID=1774748 RepID=UPI001F575497|nr:carbon-nitrogen hydrolase family protein [Sediminivirga luteola]MCI2264356.1 carbon-nitrogen hydrolase family protein [Sediminivirga luteola]